MNNKIKMKIGKWTRLQPRHNKNRNVLIFLLKFTSQTVGYFLIQAFVSQLKQLCGQSISCSYCANICRFNI